MRATGIGSLPGTTDAEHVEAVKLVLGELAQEPGLPYLPELPGRGAGAAMVGRTLAVVSGLDADLQPAGWRLTGSSGSPGIDQRRARSLLAQDLDTVEELTEGYAGDIKTQVTGPWTLAATVERPRGDKLLADHGARRDLAQALAEGVVDHVADLRRRMPNVRRLVVQVDEPAIAAVAGAEVPTASGFGRHRSVDRPELSESLGWVLGAIAEAGAEPWVHACAPKVPWDIVRGAGAVGLAVDADVLSAKDHDVLAEALEAGAVLALGVVPTLEPAGDLTDKHLIERVQRWLDMVGLDPEEVGDRFVVAPGCGLAGATWSWARRATALTRSAARHL